MESSLAIENLFMGAFLVETLEVPPFLFGSALHQKWGAAFGTHDRYGFVPEGELAARITGTAIKQLASL